MPDSATMTPSMTTNSTETKDEKRALIGADKQTFLVGDQVYLRPIVEDDAATGTSWRMTVFPHSTATTEGWIEDEIAKGDSEHREVFAIVRKVDDHVVGSLSLEYDPTITVVAAHVDPIYGLTGQGWKGEAIVLAARWQIFERHKLMVHADIPADEEATIAIITAAGMREIARLRERYQRNGQRVDWLIFDFPHPAWMERLGDPREMPLERTGSGDPRPVPAQTALSADATPPAGAIMIGQRTYLRPFVKADAALATIWAMREPEADFSLGRGAESPEAFIRQALEEQKTETGPWPSVASWMVCLRESDEAIGYVSLEDINWVDRIAETASWIFRPEYRGGGYGSEAKHLLLNYAFNHLRLHMVHSWVLFQNTRSAAALRKQGYREAGRATWCFPYKGGIGNMVLFDLLADEWRALPRA